MILRFELLRLIRSRRPLLACATLVFFLLLMLLGFYTYAQTETGGNVEFRHTFENESYFNGLTFALYAFYFAFLLVLPIFVSTEGGAQLAGESAGGTLELLLTRPVSRARLFLSKTLLACAYSSLLTGFLLLVAMLIGLLFVGWGDLDLYPGVLQMTDRPQHLSQADALVRFALAWPAASLALFAPLALSLLVSTWSRSPVNAVGVSMALYLVLYVVAEIHFFRDLRPFLFTSHMPFWRELFQADVDWARMGAQAARLCGFTTLFLALAFRRFRLREEP